MSRYDLNEVADTHRPASIISVKASPANLLSDAHPGLAEWAVKSCAKLSLVLALRNSPVRAVTDGTLVINVPAGVAALTALITMSASVAHVASAMLNWGLPAFVRDCACNITMGRRS